MTRRKPGGQSKFIPDVHLKVISEYAEQGYTDQQIADKIGITNRTLQNWKSASGELFHTLRTSKLLADDRVELSLYDRALGYPYEEVTLEPGPRVPDPTDPTGTRTVPGPLEVTKVVRKLALPDVTAQIYWTKNRRPDRWRERHEVEATLRDYRVIPADLPGALAAATDVTPREPEGKP